MRTFSKQQLAHRYCSSSASQEALPLLVQLQSHLRRCKDDLQALKRGDQWAPAAQTTIMLMRRIHEEVATGDAVPVLVTAMQCFDTHWEVQMHG